MLKNYFKIAFRNLLKSKGYSAINILGLAVGLASCILILLYVTHELSYDKHHAKADQIYRVISKINFGGNYAEYASVPAPMGPTLKQDYPEVEAVVRFRPRGSYMVSRGEINIKEEDVVFADSSVFDVFTMPLIHGNPQGALLEPFTMVISQSAAKKYFGTTNVVGESLLLDGEYTFEITGVMWDMPTASHFHFDFLLSMNTIGEADNTNWVSNNFRTYILLNENIKPEKFEELFSDIKKTYIEPQIQQFLGINLEEFEAAGNRVDYELQPLTSIHLHSDLTGEFEPNGSILYVYIFSALAVFILILACINFMNLATARSVRRAKEVGVRKTLGSVRSQLTFQFLTESILISVIASGLAVLMVELSLPYFGELAGRTIGGEMLTSPAFMGIISSVVLGAGLLAGSYPAIILSSFKPARVLKGGFTEGRGASTIRKGLVVFQFSISIIIVVGLLVINKQLSFIQNRSLGFEKDQVVVVNSAYNLGEAQRVETFRDQVLSHPEFESATISSFFPVDGYGKNDLSFWPRGEGRTQDNTVNMQVWRVDEHYIETLGMEIVKGRNFSGERGTDAHRTAVLNETAVQRFGFEDPVGQVIQTFTVNQDGSINEEELKEYTVVGVVRNFNYESLRETIAPLVLIHEASYGNVAFKIKSENAAEVIAVLEKTWSEFAPSQPFNYAFLDDRFDQMYRAESRMEDLMAAFSFLAVVIACLGLFGLSAYSAERRTKEVGIRKIMGASVSGIITLMSGEFLKLIVLSFVIAVPVSYVIMWQWLQEFTYRVNIGVDVFLIAGAAALLVALITVSWQSVKAALINPVESLRSE